MKIRNSRLSEYVVLLTSVLLGITGCGGGSNPESVAEPLPLPTFDAVAITTHPPSSTNSATATFAFANSSGSENYELKLDGGSFVSIENKSFTTPPLADGKHVVSVRPLGATAVSGQGVATVDLTNGDNTVDVMSVDSVGNESKKILHVRREPLLVRPNGLILDAVQDSLTTLDYYTGALYQFDLQNRQLNVLSDKNARPWLLVSPTDVSGFR